MESVFNKVAGLTPIMKNICNIALHSHHSPFLFCFTSYSAPSSSLSLLQLRSSLPEVLYKKGVLTTFAKFTVKYLCQNLFFNKVAGNRAATLLKKRVCYKYFPVDFVKFLRTPLVSEHLCCLLLTTVNISDVSFWFKFKRLQRI